MEKHFLEKWKNGLGILLFYVLCANGTELKAQVISNALNQGEHPQIKTLLNHLEESGLDFSEKGIPLLTNYALPPTKTYIKPLSTFEGFEPTPKMRLIFLLKPLGNGSYLKREMQFNFY
ncbi:MAG: hypothetical protein H0X62_03470 [Bacteroidetes bacterium]|nr:hypothetical protein [Bacteroidota bacterium]